MILYPPTVLLLAGEKRKVLLPDVVWPTGPLLRSNSCPASSLLKAYKVDVAKLIKLM